MTRVYIALGSNVGDRRAHLDAALRALSILPGTKLLKASGVYETKPVGPIPQGDYLNAAAVLETQLRPMELLDHLRAIEAAAGRPDEVHRQKWGPRELDLDIVLFGDRVISNDRLVVPHPHMHERRFVLEPLSEIAPDAVHPVLEMTVGALLEACGGSGSAGS